MARTSVLVSHVVPPFLLLLSRKMSEDDKNRSRKIFSQLPQHRRAGFLRFEIGSLPSCSLDRRHFDQPEARARNTLPYYNRTRNQSLLCIYVYGQHGGTFLTNTVEVPFFIKYVSPPNSVL